MQVGWCAFRVKEIGPQRSLRNAAEIAKEHQMEITFKLARAVLVMVIVAVLFVTTLGAFQATTIPTARLINPEDLLKLLQNTGSERPLMIQVGSHVLYAQAHIPGSEYIGPASSESGVQQLRKRVEPLPRTKLIVLYCGCCPWGHCPNVKPADDALAAMGFTNVRVLYISDNFGANWVDKGYPVAKGE